MWTWISVCVWCAICVCVPVCACRFVRALCEEGLGDPVRGSLSPAIHSPQSPSLINVSHSHIRYCTGTLSLINHVTFPAALNDLGGADQLEMAEAAELNCFGKWRRSQQAIYMATSLGSSSTGPTGQRVDQEVGMQGQEAAGKFICRAVPDHSGIFL